jgi:hypothetical protein
MADFLALEDCVVRKQDIVEIRQIIVTPDANLHMVRAMLP